MASPAEHGEVILASIIPNRFDLLERATRLLTEEHFTDIKQQKLFTMLLRYAETAQNVLPIKFLEDMVAANSTPGKVVLLEFYKALAEEKNEDGAFEWSVQELREERAKRETQAALTEAMAIARGGGEQNPELKGSAESRSYILDALSALNQELTSADSPEGTVNDEYDDILKDYADREAARLDGSSQGIHFGIDAIDKAMGGMQPGELVMMAAYSGQGKTQMTIQAAWHAAVKQGKNVVFYSTETTREQIRRKLVSRHSTEPQFGIPSGLNSHSLKEATLAPQEREIFEAVVKDLTTNPAYGRIHIVQVPGSWTIRTIELDLRRLSRQFEVDVVVMDYLALLQPIRPRNSEREELSDTMKEAKKVAVTYDNGRGVAFLSPWQINRQGFDAALKSGFYSSKDLAGTSEATNSADAIITLLVDEDHERRADVRFQLLKSRDSENLFDLIVEVDYATSTMRSRSTAGIGSGNPLGGNLRVL